MLESPDCAPLIFPLTFPLTFPQVHPLVPPPSPPPPSHRAPLLSPPLCRLHHDTREALVRLVFFCRLLLTFIVVSTASSYSRRFLSPHAIGNRSPSTHRSARLGLRTSPPSPPPSMPPSWPTTLGLYRPSSARSTAAGVISAPVASLSRTISHNGSTTPCAAL